MIAYRQPEDSAYEAPFSKRAFILPMHKSPKVEGLLKKALTESGL
jgi:hypothetical protein